MLHHAQSGARGQKAGSYSSLGAVLTYQKSQQACSAGRVIGDRRSDKSWRDIQQWHKRSRNLVQARDSRGGAYRSYTPVCTSAPATGSRVNKEAEEGNFFGRSDRAGTSWSICSGIGAYSNAVGVAGTAQKRRFHDWHWCGTHCDGRVLILRFTRSNGSAAAVYCQNRM